MLGNNWIEIWVVLFITLLIYFRCDEAIQLFALDDASSDALVTLSLLYKILFIFLYIILLIWVSAFIVLPLRVILAIDFRLVKVVIKSHDHETMVASTLYKTEDERDKADDGKKQHLNNLNSSEC